MFDIIKKHWNKILLGASLILLISLSFISYLFIGTVDKLSEANNVINSHNNKIQELNLDLGISESKLTRLEDLNKKYSDELNSFEKKFSDIVKKHNLEIRSRDNIIASLEGKINGGNSSVGNISDDGKFTTIVEITKEVCESGELSYKWEDDYKRFNLLDPNIFKSGDEVFEYKQYFSLTGYVYVDETGDVQIRKVVLDEVIPVEKDGVKSFNKIGSGNVKLIHSEFEYVNKIKKDKVLLDTVTLRPFALFDTSLSPGLGVELINLGNYIDYANLGLYLKSSFDVSDPLNGSLQKSKIGAGILYHIVPPVLPTNFAVGLSVNTPFDNVGQLMLTVDLVLYLTEDLKPFDWIK